MMLFDGFVHELFWSILTWLVRTPNWLDYLFNNNLHIIQIDNCQKNGLYSRFRLDHPDCFNELIDNIDHWVIGLIKRGLQWFQLDHGSPNGT